MRAIVAPMRLLARFHDPGELTRVRALLRQKGVPTWANTIEGRRLRWQAVLHVCLDAQLDDALRLLRDPAHVPAHPVDADAFERAMATDGSGLLVRATHRVLMIALGLVAVLALAVWAWGRLH